MPLTDTAVRNAKAAEKPFKMADGGGLFLYVTPAGGKLWRLKSPPWDREQLLSFGAYPTVGVADARQKREEAKRQLAEGKSPAIERSGPRSLPGPPRAAAFAKVAEELIAKREREGLAPTTAAKLRWYASLLAKIGERPVGGDRGFRAPGAASEDRGVRPLRDGHEHPLTRRPRVPLRCGHGPGTARRGGGPQGRAHRAKVTHHAAILDAEGAGRMMRSIEAYRGQRQTRIALALLAHTFPRPGELRLADWREFDLDAATSRFRPPGPMRKEHLIPLSTQGCGPCSGSFAP